MTATLASGTFTPSSSARHVTNVVNCRSLKSSKFRRLIAGLPDGYRLPANAHPMTRSNRDGRQMAAAGSGGSWIGAGSLELDRPTLAFAWLLAQPTVTAVIVGPRRPEHLEPALRALELQLDESEAAELARLFPK